MESEIFLYTDGGCKGNGYQGARASWGWALPSHQIAYSGPVNGAKQTNNTGELTAIYEGVRYLAYQISSFLNVTIVTDSAYSMKMLDPRAKWHQDSRGVPNIELIKSTYELIAYLRSLGKNVRFLHVNSHLSAAEKSALSPAMRIHSFYNDYVDQIATQHLR